MWVVAGNTLQMADEDYGLALPVTIEGTTLGENDSLRITIKKRVDGNVILTKEFSDIQENTVELVFTEAESAMLPVGGYVYSLDWYQDGTFMCNIILSGVLKVVNKA